MDACVYCVHDEVLVAIAPVDFVYTSLCRQNRVLKSIGKFCPKSLMRQTGKRIHDNRFNLGQKYWDTCNTLFTYNLSF